MDTWDLLEPVDIGPNISANFDEQMASKKWQERKEALEALHGLLAANPRLTHNQKYVDIIERLNKTLSTDANINVASMAAKCLGAFARGLRDKFAPYAPNVTPAVFEKFKEKKALLRDPLVECIDAVYASTNLAALSPAIMEALAKPNPSQKAQLDQFLYRVFSSLNAKDIPKGMLKELVAELTKHASDPDPEVRDSACAALGAIQKCIGEKALSMFLGADLSGDQSKMAKIAEYREKAIGEAPKPKAEVLPSLNTLQQTSADNRQQTAPAEMDTWDLLEPVDIGPNISANFDEQMASKKWQERKEALEALHGLLAANPRLTHNQKYVDIIERLNKTLSTDANINVASMAAKCLGAFARGLRDKFAPYAPNVTPAVFEKFKEKKALLRDPLVECIDAVYASTNLAALSPAIMEALAKPNPSQKAQLDQFLYRVFSSLNAKDIPKGMLKELVAELTKHASDPDPEVRDSACAALGAIQKCIGEKALSMFLGADLSGDQSKMAKIAEYREKAIGEAPQPKAESVQVNSTVAAAVPPIQPETQKEDKQQQQKVETPKKRPAEQQQKDEIESDSDASRAATGAATDELPPKPPKHAQKKPAVEKTPVKEEPKEQEFLLMLKSDRAGRLKEERSLRTLKWNFDVPQAEHLEQFNASISAVTKSPLTGQMLGKDFKQHIKAIEYLQEVHAAQPECIIANIDLLLKWATLRFFDTNPSVLIKVLEFVLAVFTQMDAMGESLNEVEVQAFLPYLLLKSGDAKEVVRKSVRMIVSQMNAIAVPAKIFPIVLDALKTKNSRQKAECITIADSLIEIMGVTITSTPQVTMQTFGACIADRDSTVRNAALNAIVTVWRKIGDQVFTLIGKLGEKERAMLDERIKRSGMGGAEMRPHTARDASMSRLNMSAGTTPHANESSVNGLQRARSASGHRRSLAVLPNNSMLNGTGDENPGTSRKGLSSAVSYSSNLNSTFTAQPPATAGKFQLDPKFFQDETMMATDGKNSSPGGNISTLVAGGTGSGQLNRTYTLKEGNSAAAELGKLNSKEQRTIDLQPIKPVVMRSTVNPATFSRRSESVSSISSLESAEHIDRTVHNISCLQLNIAEEAIAQLLDLLNNPTHRQYIIDRTELVLKTMVTQIFHIRSQHLEQLEGASESDPKAIELSDFMRQICNFLTSITKEPPIMQRISADTLRSFIDAILALVTDSRLTALNKQIFRALNIIVIRLCEHTNPNACFGALSKLIVKYQASDPDGKMLELIRKCLIKHTDSLSEPTKAEQVDILTVLEPIHAYYSRFYINEAETNQPSESVKTTVKLICIYIQRLVVNRRYAMLNYLHPFPENSQLVSYVRRCVRAVAKKSSTPTGEDKTSEKGTMCEELEAIFKRIDEDLFTGAVEELYNFMDVHSDQVAAFDQLMADCQYANIVRKAMAEIRQCRLKREPILPGVCVRRVLPNDVLQFLDEQSALRQRIEDLSRMFFASTPATASLQQSTLQ